METLTDSKPRMTAERHWERFDEATHDNARQMCIIAEDAIEELLQRESEKPRLKPHLFNQMISDIQSAMDKYGATQQMRTHLVQIIAGYVEPDHSHTRPK